MRAPFEQWRYGAIAASLRVALEENDQAARAVAASMHETPHPPMVAFKVPRYGRTQSSFTTDIFPVVFPTWLSFLDALSDEDPGALETAVEIVSTVDASRAFGIVREILETKPWTMMGRRAGTALARIDDPAAVALMLAHLDVAYVAGGIGRSCCSGAGDMVLARLESSSAFDVRASAFDRSETSIVEELLEYLGRHRIERAWPVLARLYEEHPDEDIRRGAGHALVAFGDARSFDWLIRFIDSDVDRRTFFAVRALLYRDAANIVAALGGQEALRDPAKHRIVSEIFQQVSRKAGDDGSGIADKALLDLALAWTKDARVKDVAQWVLGDFGKDAVAAAKKRLKNSGTVKAPPRPKKPTKAEIAAIAARIEVARSNVERIAGELHAMGYVFRAKEPVPPRVARAATIRKIEKALGGPLPISLRLALELLGGCDLTGAFPGARADLETDAFFLVDPKLALAQAKDEGGGEAQLSLGIAPDVAGKAGFSGGQEFILVPDVALDARVLGVPGEPMFLDRMHDVFAAGGFPGLRGTKGPLRAVVDRLAALCAPV